METRTCIGCLQIKPKTEYNKGNNRDGCQSYCKICDRERAKKHYHAHKNTDRFRSLLYKRNYGITLDQWNKLLIDQCGCCAICYLKFDSSDKDRLPHIDHDHITNKVRGLLCNKCNNMLGCAKDSVDTLYMAIQYLERNGN